MLKQVRLQSFNKECSLVRISKKMEFEVLVETRKLLLQTRS